MGMRDWIRFNYEKNSYLNNYSGEFFCQAFVCLVHIKGLIVNIDQTTISL